MYDNNVDGSRTRPRQGRPAVASTCDATGERLLSIKVH